MIRCPNCGHKYDLAGDRKDQALADCIRLSGRFGQAANLVFEYSLLRLGDRTLKNHELKLCRILEGLLKLWEGGKFGLQKKAYTISQAGILEALKTTCDRGLKGPLENDNYLKKIMVGISEQEAHDLSVKAEKALREKEKGLKAGQYDAHSVYRPDKSVYRPDKPGQPPRLTDEPNYDLGKEMISGILKSI